MKETTSCLHLLNGHVYLAFTLVILTNYVPAIYRERLVFKLEIFKEIIQWAQWCTQFYRFANIRVVSLYEFDTMLKGEEY